MEKRNMTPLEFLNVQLEMHVDECRECCCVRRIGAYCLEGNRLRQEIDDLIGKFELENQRRVA